jgi:carbamoyl-phosphate synthase large subunit
MSLGKLKVLLTAVGCPGGVTMIRALKDNGEREIEIVGTDMRPEAAGRFFVDRFHIVPAGNSPEFVPRLLEIVRQERPDVLFPQSSFELLPLARNRAQFEALDVPVIVASADTTERAGDKWLTYQALETSGVPRPRSILCGSLDEFLAALYELGYPSQRVCFKPPFSKGSRGFRILSAEADRLQLLLHERPDATLMTLDEAIDIFREARQFPQLMVMEYAEGIEHTVDVFCQGGQVLMGFVKTREAVKAGLGMYFETVDHPQIWQHGQAISRILEIDYFANIQFKGGLLIEINPRVSTFVHQEDFNMPYLGLKYVLGEVGQAELLAASARVRATRRTVRYYDQVFYDVQDL